MEIRIQSDSFDSGQEANAFADGLKNSGAVVTFSGVVRNNAAGDLVAMEIETYPAMAKTAIGSIVEEARARWGFEDVLVIHRHGSLKAGETIMMVATASAHRVAAFEAAEFLMDYLKSRAPFWKKEVTKSGETWVEAQEHDEAALGRWSDG